MNIVSVENISKSYGEKVLFDKLAFGLEDQDKIGLIGINGAGKSTLLKVIAGFEHADGGRMALSSNLRIAYLPQIPYFDDKATVLQQVYQGMTQGLADESKDEDDWQRESDAKIILTKLGIVDFDALMGQLSGGQRKRVALAHALISPADLLILDEPTNHIDNETIDWLEQYLRKRKGALLMITHDRYFLDRVVNRILELDRGKLYSYSGNYSKFLEIKAEREEMQQSTEKKQQNLFRNELAWIRRGAKARSTKQKARIDRFGQLSEDLSGYSQQDKAELSVSSSRLGKKVVELEHVRKGYDDRTLIEDFSYLVLRKDRVGITGANGMGKSTLLHIIGGKLQPDQGTVDMGQTVKIGCFFQENEEMNESLRVIDYIKEEAQVVENGAGETITASQLLERFLFTPTMQWTPISKLSGGEKRRLYLLRILIGAPNVLLLDEPTNDLDIQTLTILENYLDDFNGAVIAVSHDRYFLDRIAEKIFNFEGDGLIVKHVGNYSDYQQYVKNHLVKPERDRSNQRASKATPPPTSASAPKSTSTPVSPTTSASAPKSTSTSVSPTTSASAPKSTSTPVSPPTSASAPTPTQSSPSLTQLASSTAGQKDRPLKFSFKEQREYEQIDQLIADKEAELEQLTRQIEASGSDAYLLQKLLQEQQEKEAQLEELMNRWTFLNELAEAIEKNTAK
ncbi:MAG TPA: ATP-binding cassette domain-containing protein [Bacilli bacterium]